LASVCPGLNCTARAVVTTRDLSFDSREFAPHECHRVARLPQRDCQFRTTAGRNARAAARQTGGTAAAISPGEKEPPMTNPILKSLALLTLIVAGGIGTSSAAEREHRRPPQAAFDACASKSAGAACEVTFREHTMTGTCAAASDGPSCFRPAPGRTTATPARRPTTTAPRRASAARAGRGA
jgi:hypothetical protein